MKTFLDPFRRRIKPQNAHFVRAARRADFFRIPPWRWAFLICWLLAFAGDGLWARFTEDDLGNLHTHLARSFSQLALSNASFWSTGYRPMGGLFYSGIYRLFGFHPLPFRIGCFALLIGNLVLLYRVCARLGGSREAGFLAALFDGYHAWFVDLYRSTGTVYELLCFAFYTGAFDLYTGIREQERMPKAWEWTAILLLYIAALDSKELAVTLPLALGCYELIWHRPATGWAAAVRWIGREGRGILLTGLLTVPYTIGKLTGAGTLLENPLYRPAISVGRYAGSFRFYLNVIFYRDHFFRPLVLIAGMLGAAIWLRSKPLVFAWCFVLLSVLPFVFLPRYSGFFIYLPMLGWTLYAATALAMIRKKTPSPDWALFLGLAAALVPLHLSESKKAIAVFDSARRPTSETIAALSRANLHLPRGAHVFFASDPFPAGGYSLLFLMQAFYNDRTLEIGRAKDGSQANQGHWDAVLAWRDGDWVNR